MNQFRDNADQSMDIGEGIIQHLIFNPSIEFVDKGKKLFGITVRQQGRKLVIITKIYDDKRRKEVIDNLGIMSKIMMMTEGNGRIDKIHIVDSKDILDQLSKHKITADKFGKDMKQKRDIIIETIDLVTGEYVPVEFSVGIMKVEKGKNAK